MRKLQERTYSAEFLDIMKSRLGLTHDSDLVPHLKVSQPAICGYRTGKRAMQGDVALRVASITGLPLAYVLAAAQCDRESEPAIKVAWEMIAKRALAEAA